MYHCISRVVDRRFVFGEREREAFRRFMRMYEGFSDCRVWSYCVMSNHFHLLLEVPRMPDGGLSDMELLNRLGALYGESVVVAVAGELTEARRHAVGEGDALTAARVAAIHARFTYRMHDLSEFMKGLLIRFTRWFNHQHDRTGTLWEERFKSVIVESGLAARTVAAYIDLNPVRAGMVQDPADYRWSSYGEAVGGARDRGGQKAREGLVRAYGGRQGAADATDAWEEISRLYRRLLGMALAHKAGQAELDHHEVQSTMNTAEMLAGQDNGTILKDLNTAQLLACRVRYFTDGAVIGSKDFVNEVFVQARDRFSARRKDGARALRHAGAKGLLWTVRDLRVRV